MNRVAGALELVLLRHGETDWNAAGRCQGHANPPLNARGFAQAAALRDDVRPLRVDHCYTSPLARARDTAAIIAGSSERPIAVDALREIAYGAVTGLRPDEWTAIDGSLAQRWESDPWAIEFPDGESLRALEARVLPVFRALVASHRGERIAVVGHGHVHRVWLIHALGIDRRRFWSIAQPNGAMWHLSLREL